jgi:hypothetical protein
VLYGAGPRYDSLAHRYRGPDARVCRACFTNDKEEP